MPFTAFFPAGRAQTNLIDRLTSQANLQGLLRSSVAGLQAVLRRGAFDIPPSVQRATERFKMEADPMRGFIEERVINNPGFTPRMDFYNAYTAWAGINGFHTMSAQRFYESFVAAAIDTLEKPFRVVTLDGNRGYRGIALN